MTDRRDDLRFDRRLLHRPGWVSEEELEAYLESLPDVSDKAVREELPGPGSAGATGEPPAVAESPPGS